MKILVAGGFDTNDEEQTAKITAFCVALGRALAEHEHVLLNGCRTRFDALLAEAASERLAERNVEDADKRIVSYVLAGHEPAYQLGTIIRSRLADWDIASATFFVPEQVQQADVV